MNTSLFLLADEYLQAAERLADLDLDEQTIADTLEGLAGALEVKATNVAMFVRNLESAAEQIKTAEAAMAARRKSIENRAASVRAYLKAQMERVEITKIECPYFKLSIRANSPAVVIDDESQIPDTFMRTPPPPPPVPDKKLIADVLKANGTVPGAHLAHETRIEIK